MTLRNKNIILMVGIVLVLIACYHLAFRKTIEQHLIYKELILEKDLYNNVPQQLSLLKNKEQQLDSILTTYNLGSNSIQNSLLVTINSFCESNDIKVINFNEPHIEENEDYSLSTFNFTIEGSFNSLNELLYHLEQKTSFGEVISLSFEKRKNHRKGTHYLQLKVYLRNYF